MIAQRISDKMKKGSGIRAAFEEAQRLQCIYGAEQVFDLSIGNPGAPPPAKVRQTALALLHDPSLDHRYMCTAGYAAVRVQIVDSLNRRFDAACEPDNIVITPGAAGGLNAVLCALLDAGDEVVVFRPYYPAYANFIENWGARLVGVAPTVVNFQPDLTELEWYITERTKAIIVNSPHNPTGTIYSLQTAQGIAAILERKQSQYGHEIYLLSDEPYRELVYDNTCPLWWPHIYANAIVIYSFSKSLSLPGERIGYVLIPPTLRDNASVIRAVRLSMGVLGYINAPAFFQQVVAQCQDEQVDLAYYDRNRRLLYGKLRELGFEAMEPKGAFYIFVKSPLEQEADFLKLARRQHLIFVGGSAFDWEGYVRLSFCGPYDTLERALPALQLLAADCGLIRGGSINNG